MNENKVNEETIEKSILNDVIKIDKSYMIYHNIVKKKLPFKFKYLDDWHLVEAKKLLKEAQLLEYNLCKDNSNKINPKYRKYKRGTIIQVDFGVSLGCEMSQVHFAIVLNNYDNEKNNVLTVVPLTSQPSKFNLDLGTLVIGELAKKIDREILTCISTVNGVEIRDEIKMQKLQVLISYYTSKVKNTYACCSLITTISKTRILRPINAYDIIGKAICSNEVMDKIDAEMFDRFTKKQVDNV